MTDELTKTFFDTFGIKQKTNQIYGIQLDYHIEDYPQITDRILLELICIMADFTIKEDYCYTIFANNIEMLRVHILEDCIECKENIKQQVQALFSERGVK